MREEQHIHIKNMLKQAEEVEKKLSEEEVVDKKEVITAMMENWAAERLEDKNVAGKNLLTSGGGGGVTLY